MVDYCVVGASGFLGSRCVKYLEMSNKTVHKCVFRLEETDLLRDEILKTGSKYVICAAGLSGHPIIDYCEQHPEETKMVNFELIVKLMYMCSAEGLHLTIFGSGYIFTGDKPVYTEDDIGDLTKFVYCRYKILLESVLVPNVLFLRIMYPASFDGHPRCFYQKTLGRRHTLHNSRVSITSIPDLFPQLDRLIQQNPTGIYNFVIDGSVRLSEFFEDSVQCSDEEPYGSYELSANKLKALIPVINNIEFINRVRCEYSSQVETDS